MAELGRFEALSGQPPATDYPPLNNMDPNGQRRKTLAYNQSVSQSCAWDFPLTVTPTGDIELTIFWATAQTTGTVRWGARIEAKAEGDILDQNTTTGYDADNLAVADTVPANGYNPAQTIVPITNVDGWVVGDDVRIEIFRDTANDTSPGPALFKHAVLTDGN